MNILVTGASGQDGPYMLKYLIDTVPKEANIFALYRRPLERCSISEDILSAIENGRIQTCFGDITDPITVTNLFEKLQPTHILNFAAQSHVGLSYSAPYEAIQVNTVGVLNFLECLRKPEFNNAKFYQASTSELFGFNDKVPQSEDSRFSPNSPYAIAKLASYHFVKSYREGYNVKAWNGILFNHESPLRGSSFVTQKSVIGAINFIKNGRPITLGNLDSVRDWGHAKEYMEVIWSIVNQTSPGDFAVGTGEGTTVREMVTLVFNILGLCVEWRGKGIDEKAFIISSEKFPHLVGKIAVAVSEEFFRPNEVDKLIADVSKIQNEIGWTPKTTLKELLEEMINYRLAL